MPIDHPPPTEQSSSFFKTARLLLTLASVALLLSGCRTDSDETVQSDTPNEVPVVISLESTISGLQPDEFDINVPRDLPATDLNEWADAMLVDLIDQDVDEKELADALSMYVSKEEVQRVLERQFVLRDSIHLRDMLWAREVVGTLSADGETDKDRVVDLFYFVTNMVRVKESQTLPLGPFEVVQFGQGTAADRAWVFSILLKQLRIPTVVFDNADPASNSTPEPDEPDAKALAEASEDGPLVLGVLLNDSTYLFDMTAGLPIPGPNDVGKDTLIRKPATLSQVLSDPALLTRLRTSDDSDYPLTVDKLKASRPLVVGDTTLWSRRMEGLQNAVAGDVSATIYEQLVSSGAYEGTIEFVADSLSEQFSADVVGVWSYPEARRQARESLSEEEKSSFEAITATFSTPHEIIVTSPTTKDIEGGWDPNKPKIRVLSGRGWHRKARIDQILARPDKAIPVYLKVQLYRSLPPSPEDVKSVPPSLEPLVIQHLPQDLKIKHLRAAEEALFWRATCQVQKKEFEAAAKDFEVYLRQIAGRTYEGRFKSEANFLAGLSLGLAGNHRRGMAFLRNVSESSSRFQAARILIRRWTALAAENE